MTLYAYTAHDHCTGRRWISQFRANSEEQLRGMLRSIYGNGLEIITVKPIQY